MLLLHEFKGINFGLTKSDCHSVANLVILAKIEKIKKKSSGLRRYNIILVECPLLSNTHNKYGNTNLS